MTSALSAEDTSSVDPRVLGMRLSQKGSDTSGYFESSREDAPLLNGGDYAYKEETEIYEPINGTTHANILESIYRVPIKVKGEYSGATPLYRKRCSSAKREAAPRPTILLIHGWAQNHWSFHIPGRSFHNYLAHLGFDTFAIDQRGTTKLSKELGAKPATSFVEALADLLTTIDIVRGVSGSNKIFLIGHSFGGALSCALAGEVASKVRGIVCIAGLYELGHDMRPVRATVWPLLLMCSKLLPKRLCYPIRKAAPGLAAWPRLAYSIPGAVFSKNSVGKKDMKEYLRLSVSAPTIGLTADLLSFRDSAKHNPRNHELLEQFERTDMPYLGVAGRSDWLVNYKDSQAACTKSCSSDKTFLIMDDVAGGSATFGHCDIIVGTRAPAIVWPEIGKWLTSRVEPHEKVLSPDSLRLDTHDPHNPWPLSRM